MTSTADNARVDATSGGEPDPRRWRALAVVAVAQLMVVLDASVVNIALPSAQADLGISDADRQWVITAYGLAFGGLLLLGGRIADFIGRKRAFVIGLIGFAVASAIGGVATTPAVLFGSRGLQGVFAALLAPAALSLLNVAFTEPKERAKAFGVYGAVAGGGAAMGLVLGGLLTEYASWRWCLLINVPIALAAAAATRGNVRESRASGTARYDVPGAILATAGLVSLVYGFGEAAAPGVGWGAATTVSFLAAGVVMLVAFVVVEARSPHPLLPLRVVLDRDRGGAFLSSALLPAGLFALFLFLAFYFQANLGYSPIRAGLAFLPFSLGVIATAGVASSLLPRIGPKPLLVAGGLLGGAGLMLLVRIEQDSGYASTVLPALVVTSVGAAMVFVTASALALQGVSDDDAGVASALVNATPQIGGSLGTAVLSTIYASAVADYVKKNSNGPADIERLLPAAAIEGYHQTFMYGALLLAVSAFVALFLVRDSARAELPVGGPPV